MTESTALALTDDSWKLPPTREVADLMTMLWKAGVPISPDQTLRDRVNLYAENYAQYTDGLSLKDQIIDIEGEKAKDEPVVHDKIADDLADLKGHQLRAWPVITNWLAGDRPYLILKGYAGSGKTYLMQKLLKLSDQYKFKFTAPTNKATNGLAEMIGVNAVTIYSLLGIRMLANEDKLVLSYPDEMPYVPRGTIVVIDEAGMINNQLMKFIRKVRRKLGLRIFLVGDPKQFNPIGENISPAWKITDRRECMVKMTKVLRFDNEILRLSARIRRYMDQERFKVSPIRHENSNNKGVFLLDKSEFRKRILKLSPEDFKDTKILAWRNRCVNRYNRMVRNHFGYEDDYVNGEVIMLAEPIEEDGKIVAHTDDEGVISKVKSVEVPVDGNDIPCWSFFYSSRLVSKKLLVPIIGDDSLDKILTEKANLAQAEKNKRRRSMLWRDFWTVKKQFCNVRYSYSMTCHRVQGATLKQVFVDQEDILSNWDKVESFRALYVACTRPTDAVFTY